MDSKNTLILQDSNAVGYTTVEIPAQSYTMIGVQFDGVDGEEGISIQDLISNPLDKLPGATTPNGRANAAQLWYWDPNESGNYVQLYLCNNTSGTGEKYGKWCTAIKPADTTWGENRNVVSTKRLTSGMGLWLVRPIANCPETSLTMSGSVVLAETGRTYHLHTGYNMVSGGFTTEFNINDGLNWIGLGLIGASTPNGRANADQLWYFDTNESGNYVQLYLCSNTSGTGEKYGKWCTAVKPNDTTWGENRNVVSPKRIPAGRGFWIIRPSSAGNVDITLPQPYSL